MTNKKVEKIRRDIFPFFLKDIYKTIFIALDGFLSQSNSFEDFKITISKIAYYLLEEENKDDK